MRGYYSGATTKSFRHQKMEPEIMRLDRRLFLQAGASALLVSPALAQITPGGTTPFNLGKRWKIVESSPAGPHWEGTWTRSGDTNFFQAYWREQRFNKEEVRDVVEFKRMTGNKVELFRASLNGTYTGTVSPDGLKIRGTATWYGPNDFWSAEIEV
jgi:hypothetical protein